jgi:hypothetical protein
MVRLRSFGSAQGRHHGAARGSDARLVVDATRTPAEALNVGAAARQGRVLPPLVVMTPRSGWWQCASERGGASPCNLGDALLRVRGSRATLFLA